jgi:hypothetical protein
VNIRVRMASPVPRRPRPSFVVTLSASAAAAALVACGGSVQTNPAVDGDADTTDAPDSPDRPDTPRPATECPKAAPRVGDPCIGTMYCDYGCGPGTTTSGNGFQCTGGKFEDRSHSCNPPPPECPLSRPRLGASCVGSSFGSCSYPDLCEDRPRDSSGFDALTCGLGVWRLSTTYVATCPATEPIDGSSCTCGDHYYGDCKYGDCYGIATTDAHCDAVTGIWRVMHSTCNPPPPDFDAGGADAGSAEAGSGTAEAGHT